MNVLVLQKRQRILSLFPSNRAIPICLALVYAIILISLPIEEFKDRVNYLNYAENSWSILKGYYREGLLELLFNDPLWLLINSGLAILFPPDLVLRFLIFFPSAYVAWFVLSHERSSVLWLILLLLLPVILNSFIVHIRQGVAISFFLFGCRVGKRPLRIIVLGLAPFIHASFFFVLSILCLARIMVYLRLAADIRTLGFIISGLVVGSGLGWLTVQLGARQASIYEFKMAEVSGLGFIFWLVVFFIWCFQGRGFLRKYAFESGIIAFYLSTYFLIEVTGRIFESALVLVLLAGLKLTGWRRITFLNMLLVYGVMQWLLRFSQPMFGFGFD